MISLLSIDIGFDLRAHDIPVRLVQEHPLEICYSNNVTGEMDVIRGNIEEVAETLAKNGYKVITHITIDTGREIQCTSQDRSPCGDYPDYEWDGPAWAIQRKNDNYWCVAPSLIDVLQRANYKSEDIKPLDE